MLNLPINTELNKPLAKNAIFQKFNMNTAQRDKFDADISRIYIANELSEKTINIKSGETIHSIFVLHIVLKQKNIDQNNITLLSKIIPQNMIYLLEFEESYKLAIFHTKLLETDWTSSPSLSIQGLTLDAVWENFVKAIRSEELGVRNGELGVRNDIWDDGISIEENIAQQEATLKLQKQIDLLEKKMRNAKQFNQQVKIKHEIQRLKEALPK